MVVTFLTAFPPVLERPQSESYLDAGRAVIEPAVGDIELQHFRVVPEAVVIVVECLEIAGNVTEDDGAPALAHLEGRGNVEIGLRVIHRGKIHEERLLVRRFAVFCIYLACNGFHSIDDSGQTLGDLDALKPLARHVGESERGRDAAH